MTQGQVRARVSVDEICRETAVSDRSVRRAIRSLEARGILSRRGVDEFVIDMDALHAMPRVGHDHDA